MLMFRPLLKAKSRQQIEFERQLAESEDAIKKAFARFLVDVQDATVLSAVRRHLQREDVAAAMKELSQYIEDFSDSLPAATIRSARDELRFIMREEGLVSEALGGTRIEFNPGNARTARVIERSRLNLIKEFTNTQREAVREALDATMKAGKHPLEAARAFKESIGLTRHQMRAVNNYRKLLEQGSKGALDRALRDKRFDRSVLSALDENKPLTASQIDRMVDRYYKRWIDYRAKTIARTEGMRAVSQGRHLAWWQTVMKIGGDPDKVVKTWHATNDDRTRDTHSEMDGQEVIGIDTPFETPGGEELRYPADPLGSPEETINCRCAVTMRIPARSITRSNP